MKVLPPRRALGRPHPVGDLGKGEILPPPQHDHLPQRRFEEFEAEADPGSLLVVRYDLARRIDVVHRWIEDEYRIGRKGAFPGQGAALSGEPVVVVAHHILDDPAEEIPELPIIG